MMNKLLRNRFFITSLAFFLSLAGPVALLSTSRVNAAPAQIDLYVASNGNDQWSGNVSTPSGNDGPLATIDRARQVVASRKAAGTLTSPTIIWIRGGTYNLTTPLAFTDADSGTSTAPITYEAYPNEQPILTSNRQITGQWQDYSGNSSIKMISIPTVQNGSWDFANLSVAGQSRVRAHTPAGSSMFHIIPFDSGSHPSTPWGGQPRQNFYYANSDINSSWKNLQDIEVHSVQRFVSPVQRITSVDPSNHLVTTDTPMLAGSDYYGYDYTGADAYYLDNVFEALTPGGWYLDRQAGILYYWPKNGENVATLRVEAPTRAQLISISGTTSSHAHNLAFKGLTLTGTTYPLPSNGGFVGFITANPTPDPAAVSVKYGDGVQFIGNTIHDVSGNAYQQLNSINSLIQGNTFYNIGTSGVQLNAVNFDTATRTEEGSHPSNNTVTDNTIHDVGLRYLEAPGITLFDQNHSTISHNAIFNGNYAGIYSLGDSTSTASSHDNRFEYNDIHNVMQTLNDGGGIYLFGAQLNTIINNNRIHDINSQNCVWFCTGIYLDVLVTKISVTNNLVYRPMVGLLALTNTQNTFSNNIIADASWIGISIQGGSGHTFSSNIISLNNTLQTGLLRFNTLFNSPSAAYVPLTEADRKAFSDPSNASTTAADYNSYYDSPANTQWNGNVAQWLATGADPHSSQADPQYTDYSHDAFTVATGSPSLALGFQQIGLNSIGPRVVLLDQLPNTLPSPSPLTTPVLLTSVGGQSVGNISSTVNITSIRPLFSGTAPAGTVIEVTVHSDPLSCTTAATPGGLWSCQLSQDLPPGQHTVEVRANGILISTYALAIIPVLPITGEGMLIRTTLLLSLLGLLFWTRKTLTKNN